MENEVTTMDELNKKTGLGKENIIAHVAEQYGVSYADAMCWFKITNENIELTMKYLAQLVKHKRELSDSDKIIEPEVEVEQKKEIGLSEWVKSPIPKHKNPSLNTIRYVDSPSDSKNFFNDYFYIKLTKENFSKLKIGDKMIYFNGMGWVEETLDIYRLKSGIITFVDPTDSIIKRIDVLDPTINVYISGESDFDIKKEKVWDDNFEKIKKSDIVKQIKNGDFTVERQDYTKPNYVKTNEGELIGPFSNSVCNDVMLSNIVDTLAFMQLHPDYQTMIDKIVECSEKTKQPIFNLNSETLIELFSIKKITDQTNHDCVETLKSDKCECKINEPLKENSSTELFSSHTDEILSGLTKKMPYGQIIELLCVLFESNDKTHKILKEIVENTKKI